MWGAIKKALNSTVGTSDFQSLDKIIKSQRTYGPSDDILVRLFDDSIELPTSTTVDIGAKFVSLVDGSIRVKATALLESTSTTSNTAYLYIYEDGELLKTITITKATTGSGTEQSYVTGTADINIQKGKRYTFSAKKTANASFDGYLTYIFLCGRIVDLSMFEYTTY